MNQPVPACIALGSNRGDSRAILDAAIRAIEAMPGGTLVCCSTWHETMPVGPIAQGKFLNGAVLVETTLAPPDLLRRLLEIERAHGRDRSAEQRWGPRTLDLDILLIGERVMHTQELTLPHPRMHERGFVLGPLVEIAPELRHPVLQMTIRELWTQLVDTSKTATG